MPKTPSTYQHVTSADVLNALAYLLELSNGCAALWLHQSKLYITTNKINDTRRAKKTIAYTYVSSVFNFFSELCRNNELDKKTFFLKSILPKLQVKEIKLDIFDINKEYYQDIPDDLNLQKEFCEQLYNVNSELEQFNFGHLFVSKYKLCNYLTLKGNIEQLSNYAIPLLQRYKKLCHYIEQSREDNIKTEFLAALEHNKVKIICGNKSEHAELKLLTYIFNKYSRQFGNTIADQIQCLNNISLAISKYPCIKCHTILTIIQEKYNITISIADNCYHYLVCKMYCDSIVDLFDIRETFNEKLKQSIEQKPHSHYIMSPHLSPLKRYYTNKKNTKNIDSHNITPILYFPDESIEDTFSADNTNKTIKECNTTENNSTITTLLHDLDEYYTTEEIQSFLQKKLSKAKTKRETLDQEEFYKNESYDIKLLPRIKEEELLFTSNIVKVQSPYSPYKTRRLMPPSQQNNNYGI